MEISSTTLIIVVYVLATADLMVGVSNEAKNFLSTTIGIKAIPMKSILAIARVVLLVNAVFSIGYMEVARKGIFCPTLLNLKELLSFSSPFFCFAVARNTIGPGYGVPVSGAPKDLPALSPAHLLVSYHARHTPFMALTRRTLHFAGRDTGSALMPDRMTALPSYG